MNGKTVTELGSKADIDNDHIKVDGRLLHAPKHLTYIALNKPKECMTTVSDPEGRQTVMHLMRGVRERVFPVGRLDYHSEGLLLLTNDGEFAHRLTAPANHVTKTYVVKVNGALTEAQEKQFREGIPMHGRKTAPAELKRIKHGTESLVRSEDHRGPAEPDPHHVQTFRQAGGEAAPRENRVPGTGRRAGALPLADAPGSGKVPQGAEAG